ncbi:hypothetical protein [Mesomycoplasma lagogenitalium]|uniref:Phosphagen kinase C-terminal domain-containing protein n=1 Tax=Mesomycoplasma lagogenitalium TaxID=171286 RepID=A0ABY8LTF3_9BACT|nr:hypothetical protein [Mesomycoplasma lagogenitalium]WGI36524.1 hypothetical protein QEG99_03600 [Mesomycoplasma lagogenitalium]
MSKEERKRILEEINNAIINEDINELPKIFERNEKGSWKKYVRCMKNLAKL